MKPNRILFIAAILAALSSHAQQDTIFKMDETGITDFLVIPIEGKTKSDIYNSTINWVKSTYKDPNEVVKAQIENESIRIEGVKENLVTATGLMGERLGILGRYQIEISFKDGKYKFDLLSIETYSPQSGWSAWYPYNNFSRYYKNGQLIKSCRYYNEIPEYFNELNRSLKKYILGGNSSNGDW
jgi:hypothetical protein